MPMSVRLPRDLRQRVRRFARARGLEEATAIRMVLAEHLNEIELDEDLTKAEEGQRAPVYEALERLQRGGGKVGPEGAASPPPGAEIRRVQLRQTPFRVWYRIDVRDETAPVVLVRLFHVRQRAEMT